MSNGKIIDHDDTFNKEKLGLFFDPYYNELKSFRSYGIEVNRLIIVFLDISNFSDLSNELFIGKRKEELLLFLKNTIMQRHKLSATIMECWTDL